MKKLKDRVFHLAVESNPNILSDYQRYKWGHIDKKENKLKSWSYLLSLNFVYRVLKIQGIRAAAQPFVRTSHDAAVEAQNIKLPYLDGSESGILKRIAPFRFAKELLQYDIISFDVFDTLILRPFSQPHHLFMLLGERHGIVNFMHIRMEAEQNVRQIAQLTKGNREVTIYDIYEAIEKRTGLDKMYGVQVEVETELELCTANPYMKKVFEILKFHEKKVIVASDMYLPKDIIVRILENNGYTGLHEVFVSCENNCSKGDEGLYNLILHRMERNTKIVHIGDNYRSDIINASKFGIETKYYKNVHEEGNKYRVEEMSELVGAAYSGVVNIHLHNGVNQFSPQYEYGFIYGGLYVVGFCRWIYEHAKQNNLDKVLFLARDGEIYKKVFDSMYPDMPTEYVYWSRIANIKYITEINRDDFLTKMLAQKTYEITSTTIKGLLTSLGLHEMIGLLHVYNLSEDEIIHKGNLKTLERFFVENWNMVLQHFAKENECVKEYFTYVLGASRRVSIVDVGWIGSGGSAIKYLIEKKWRMDCKAFSLVAATRHQSHSANLAQLMKGEPEAYIFSRMFNRNLYDVHSNTNNGANNIFFELFTQARTPSFAGFEVNEDGYKMLFDIPEIENYETIAEVQRGIEDFARIYKETFKDFDYLFNISGYDAYLPFRFIIKDLRFIKKHFNHMLFSRGVIGDMQNQRLKKMSDILDHLGL